MIEQHHYPAAKLLRMNPERLIRFFWPFFKSRGLISLAFFVLIIALISVGCAGSPSRTAQVPPPTLQPVAPVANQQPVTPVAYQQPIVPSGEIQPGPSAGFSAPSAIVPTIAVETLEEDTSGSFPVSILPPEQPITTAPPKILPEPPPTPASISDPLLGKDKDADFWSKMAPEYIYKSIKNAAGYGPNENIARAAFKEGQQLFLQKKYAEAAEKFKTAADRWPDTPLEEDSLFMLAESYFFSDQYPKAHDTYEKLFKKFSNSRHLDVAVAREFALGRYWVQLYDHNPTWPIAPNLTNNSKPLFDTFGYAIKAYQNVRMYDPTGPLADDSLMASATAYFRRGQFQEAALEFDLLRKEYPNSEHQKAAHLLGLQTKMRIYQGKYYDPIALVEAGEITQQALTQFGPQLGPEKTRVLKAQRQILEEKANRDFAMAEYYQKLKYFGAARMYYQCVIDSYPSTQRAKDARERLDAIKGEPDEPTNYFKWLSNLIPSDRK